MDDDQQKRRRPEQPEAQALTRDKVGAMPQIEESTVRLAALIESRGGRWEVFTSTSRFVTGLGRSHPVENGFAWRPTLGTPYLPGSSVKGMARAWGSWMLTRNRIADSSNACSERPTRWEVSVFWTPSRLNPCNS